MLQKISRQANVPANNANIVRHATTFSIRFPAVHLHFYPALFLPALVHVVQYKGTRRVKMTVAVMLSGRRQLTWLFVGE